MKTRPCVGESTIAWNPCGVQSIHAVAPASSSPCPAHVLISGNWAASSGAIMPVSTIAKRATSPSGIGSVMTVALVSDAGLRSIGAPKNWLRMTSRSRDTVR